VITTAALLLSGILLTPTVSAAPQSAAYQLVFTTQPVNTTVGAKMASVVVQLKSQNGTNVPQSGSTNGLKQNISNPAPVSVPCKISLTPPPSDGCVKASVTGTSGQTYVLQASTDMIHWTAISTNAADANRLLLFSDPDATNYPSRFYRSATLQ
jgi:hypothetical protein